MDEPIGQTNSALTNTAPTLRESVHVEGADCPLIDASRWIVGPDADPLRPNPWFAQPRRYRVVRQPSATTDPLPRPRRFKPNSFGRRLRSAIVLLCVLALIVILALNSLQVSHTIFGFSLPHLPHLPLP